MSDFWSRIYFEHWGHHGHHDDHDDHHGHYYGNGIYISNNLYNAQNQNS